ncbi:hypothetical protein EV356DRAFT_511200 [Viridothelium virens]|uniref:FAM50A/XAP5 C-terminal domain-containing protein n=1 Tax=Viridothelium virens TaxID=1048519 RepID=A0A6A6HPF1_VIRVR|nr:hypothetical protein EV356DRAFT_511200 [Viridothelium virens]
MDPVRGVSTSNSLADSRFKTQNATTEDILKSQTVGLVKLEDFRKRRAEVLDPQSGSDISTRETTPQPKKKPKKPSAKPLLSFDTDESNADGSIADPVPANSEPADASASLKRPWPNTSSRPAPKNMTKSALAREARIREELRREYLAVQEIVKATEVVIPFVFYEGANKPGGAIKMKKGEQISLFLDRARKVGIRSGQDNSAEKKDSIRKGWARMSMDELMLVRGDMIVPHHYDLYHFIINKSEGYYGALFDFSAEPTAASPSRASTTAEPSYQALLLRPGEKKTRESTTVPDAELEGASDDPNLTKVVDRNWYTKNKHIYPASSWREFEEGKEYGKGPRTDAEGNPYFLGS